MSNFGPSNRSSTESAGRVNLRRLWDVSSPREPSHATGSMSFRPVQSRPLRNSKYARLTFARWSLGEPTVSSAQRASLIPRRGFKRSQDRIKRRWQGWKRGLIHLGVCPTGGSNLQGRTLRWNPGFQTFDRRLPRYWTALLLVTLP